METVESLFTNTSHVLSILFELIFGFCYLVKCFLLIPDLNNAGVGCVAFNTACFH